MAKGQHSDVREWALWGAAQRLEQIDMERAAIHRSFPELRVRAGRTGGSRTRAVRSSPDSAAASKRGRRTLSAAARKRISTAQKARWAKLKAGKQAAKR